VRMNLRERFEAMVIPEPNSGCHIWTGARRVGGLGYGKFVVHGRQVGAHRVAWEIYRGPIPDGLHVLHKCDTPSCVNPDHLFLGDQAANNRDMFAKGRAYDRSGHSNSRSKLSPEQVRQIRAMPKKEQATIAEMYGVSQSTVSRVQRMEVYRDARAAS
jgi:hypothetical protein